MEVLGMYISESEGPNFWILHQFWASNIHSLETPRVQNNFFWFSLTDRLFLQTSHFTRCIYADKIRIQKI